jgi:hypothetical protein
MFTPESKEVLYDKAPRFERAYRILMQRHLAVTQNRFDTISKTATDKYVDFFETIPYVAQPLCPALYCFLLRNDA